MLRLLVFLAVLALALPARADLEAGYRAYQAGDYEAALAAWREAAEAGDGEALHNLGVLHELGDGVPEDPAEAARWYEQAIAAAGVPESAFNLANLYREGRGVERDFERAAELYWQAGQAGHPSALNNLGGMVLNGMGMPPDPALAAEFFAMAAEQGSVRGLVALARLYEEGHGVEQDVLEAVRLFRIAAGTGDSMAQSHLPTMRLGLEAAYPPGENLVRQAQSFLTALGYEPGPIDGAMGPRTREAIAAFERAQGLAEQGEATAELRRELIDVLLTPARLEG